VSQIASAFAVPSGALPELRRHLSAADWECFWGRLRPFEVGAGFPYSGYVVTVLTEYLRETGVELPVSRDPAVQFLVARCDPLACAGRRDAAAAAAALAGVGASDAALATYWLDFTGDGWAEAGAAMRAALDWLRQVLAAGQASDWCIVLEG
jgi:hypothetical protein